MKPIIVTRPDRNNWEQFCQEPPLTDAEFTEWREMASVIVKNDALFNFITAETEVERAALQANNLLPCTDDWSDMVRWADAMHALKRAEIEAYQKWLKEESCPKI